MITILFEIEVIHFQGLPGRTGWNQRLSCFLILASNCSKSLERKYMSEVRQKTSVLRPYLTSITKIKYFQASRNEKVRSIQGTLEVGERLLELVHAGCFCHN